MRHICIYVYLCVSICIYMCCYVCCYYRQNTDEECVTSSPHMSDVDTKVPMCVRHAKTCTHSRSLSLSTSLLFSSLLSLSLSLLLARMHDFLQTFVRSLACLLAGGEVVGGSKDGALRIWDVGGRMQHVAQLHTAPVTSCR